MLSLLDRLHKGETILADGALGTMLFPGGALESLCVEKINIMHPKHLEIIANDYLDAGAEIIQTNTFGATPVRLEQFNLSQHTKEINQNGVQTVRNVIKEKAYLSFTCGPTGISLDENKDENLKKIIENYHIQFESVKSEQIDLISIETMMFFEEAVVAYRAAREIFESTPISISLLFRKKNEIYQTYDNFLIDDVINKLQNLNVDIIGSNCGNSSKSMIDLAKTLCNSSELPVNIRPSAGIPKKIDNLLVYPENKKLFCSSIKEMINSGVQIVGGCCGTTPDYISLLKSSIL